MWRIREAGDPVDVVIITPEPGRAKEIGRKLLAMAANPRDVQWVTWPQAGFSIPLELFVQFAAEADNAAETAKALWQMPLGELEKLAGGTIEPGHIDADDETPAKRRRGRPRKQEETSTDDTTTSPEEE